MSCGCAAHQKVKFDDVCVMPTISLVSVLVRDKEGRKDRPPSPPPGARRPSETRWRPGRLGALSTYCCAHTISPRSPFSSRLSGWFRPSRRTVSRNRCLLSRSFTGRRRPRCAQPPPHPQTNPQWLPPMHHHLDGYLATPADQRKLLTTMVGCEFAEGRALHAGVPGTSFFIISEGTADVVVDGKVVQRCGPARAAVSYRPWARAADQRRCEPPARSRRSAHVPRCSNSSLVTGLRPSVRVGAVPRQSTAGCRCDSAASGEHLSAYGMALLADVLQPVDFPDGEWLQKGAAAGSLAGGAWDGHLSISLWRARSSTRSRTCSAGWDRRLGNSRRCKAASIDTRRPWQAALRRSRGQRISVAIARRPRLQRSRRARRWRRPLRRPSGPAALCRPVDD